MKTRANELLDRSIAAMLSAIEIYNKPSFLYRSEAFSIMAINAWELLLKAKILLDNNNKLNSLWVYEKRKNKNGSLSKKSFIKLTASKNPFTHSLDYLIKKMVEDGRLDKKVGDNIDVLINYRDSAIHFYNQSQMFQIRIQEIGMACLKNYTTLLEQWFHRNLSEFDIYLMPLAFINQPSSVEAITFPSEEKNFVTFINAFDNEDLDPNATFSVTVNVEVKFARSKAKDALSVQMSNAGDAIKLSIDDEQFAEKYKLSYNELSAICQKRYSDFSSNAKYHNIRKKLAEDQKYGILRYLDPKKKKGLKKPYFSEAILNEFDKHYTKK